MSLGVRAQPGAKREKILGAWNGSLRVAVQAPAQEGRANEALLRFLAKSLGLRPAQLRLLGGEKSREKRVAIAGETAESLRRRIAEAIG